MLDDFIEANRDGNGNNIVMVQKMIKDLGLSLTGGLSGT